MLAEFFNKSFKFFLPPSTIIMKVKPQLSAARFSTVKGIAGRGIKCHQPFLKKKTEEEEQKVTSNPPADLFNGY